MPLCKRCIVSGVVQGVYFRASAQRQAQHLGCTGWTRNLPDGRVEVYVCGEDYQVEEFIRWLWVGPRRAKVSHVECKRADLADFDDFVVRYD